MGLGWVGITLKILRAKSTRGERQEIGRGGSLSGWLRLRLPLSVSCFGAVEREL
jgi:hypothetical protein